MYFEINLKNSTLATAINCGVKKEFCNISLFVNAATRKLLPYNQKL